MNRTLPLLLVLACAACATAPVAPTESSGSSDVCGYFPLAVGNTWVYDGPPVPGGGHEPITIAITGKKGGYYEQTGEQLIACDAEGVHGDSRVLLRGPVQVGKTWKSVVSIGTTESYEIIDVGAMVNVPAGAFSDTVTTLSRVPLKDPQHPGAVLLNEVTFAPGVGIVRISTRLQDGERVIPQIELALRSFKAAEH
jgi:hypothetical protein